LNCEINRLRARATRLRAREGVLAGPRRDLAPMDN